VLAGETHAARVGLSVLTAGGISEFAARTPGEYAAQAARLASDAGRRRQLRRSLREQVRAGPLCDGAAFCRRFEAALVRLWDETIVP
jgi:predicted O-linked N-acetylglucosamine transferase (SPINDLY family)